MGDMDWGLRAQTRVQPFEPLTVAENAEQRCLVPDSEPELGFFSQSKFRAGEREAIAPQATASSSVVNASPAHDSQDVPPPAAENTNGSFAGGFLDRGAHFFGAIYDGAADISADVWHATLGEPSPVRSGLAKTLLRTPLLLAADGAHVAAEVNRLFKLNSEQKVTVEHIGHLNKTVERTISHTEPVVQLAFAASALVGMPAALLASPIFVPAAFNGLDALQAHDGHRLGESTFDLSMATVFALAPGMIREDAPLVKSSMFLESEMEGFASTGHHYVPQWIAARKVLGEIKKLEAKAVELETQLEMEPGAHPVMRTVKLTEAMRAVPVPKGVDVIGPGALMSDMVGEVVMPMEFSLNSQALFSKRLVAALKLEHLKVELGDYLSAHKFNMEGEAPPGSRGTLAETIERAKRHIESWRDGAATYRYVAEPTDDAMLHRARAYELNAEHLENALRDLNLEP